MYVQYNYTDYYEQNDVYGLQLGSEYYIDGIKVSNIKKSMIGAITREQEVYLCLIFVTKNEEVYYYSDYLFGNENIKLEKLNIDNVSDIEQGYLEEAGLIDVIITKSNGKRYSFENQQRYGENNEKVENEKLNNSNLITGILVNGEDRIIESDKYGETIGGYIEDNAQNKDLYDNKEYNIYTKNQFITKTIGRTELGTYEGTLAVRYSANLNNIDNTTIAIMQSYNAMPRKSNKVNMPEYLYSGYENREMEEIDLDGDGNNEYIFILNKNENGESKIVLANKKENAFEEISTLLYTINGDFFNCSIDSSNVMYIDVDNDGIMEILLIVPGWEWSNMVLFKYQDGTIRGNTYTINGMEGP